MRIDNEVFLDASFVIAIATSKDRHHQRAIEISDYLTSNNIHIVTSHSVLMEIGNGLSRLRYRLSGNLLLESIHSDESVEILPITQDLYDATFALYSQRTDKELGLTDCSSFEIMRRRNITQALTADDHFTQAGYIALLLADI